MPSTRFWNACWNAIGFASLLALLLLASPGVKLARAGAEHAGAPAQCGTAAAAQKGDPELAAFLQELRREHYARIFEGQADPDVVVLNNQGFNYAVDRDLLAEVMRVRAEAQKGH